MTSEAIHVDVASEVFTRTGPTGRFREVVEACVVDAGGNILAGPGPVGIMLAKSRAYLGLVALVPTVLGGECSTADTLILLHIEEE